MCLTISLWAKLVVGSHVTRLYCLAVSHVIRDIHCLSSIELMQLGKIAKLNNQFSKPRYSKLSKDAYFTTPISVDFTLSWWRHFWLPDNTNCWKNLQCIFTCPNWLLCWVLLNFECQCKQFKFKGKQTSSAQPHDNFYGNCHFAKKLHIKLLKIFE